MYGRIILFILVAFYQLSAISGEFLQVYYHNGEFKEDLKIYGTGLVKLSTSSFESTCGNKGGDFSKRFLYRIGHCLTARAWVLYFL